MRLGNLALVGVLVLAATSARADQTFTFSYSFPGSGNTPTPVSGNGLLTTTDLDAMTNAYTILGISGTRNFNGTQQTITGLIPPGNFGGNDNLLFTTAPLLDSGGFSFSVNGTGNSGSQVNVLYLSHSIYTENSSNVGLGSFTATNVTGAAVPEPGSVALLVGLGISGAGFLSRRRSTRKGGSRHN